MAAVRFAAEAKRSPTKVDEWQRQRRTAYSSGRRELIGYKTPEIGQPKRKVLNKNKSVLGGTHFRSKFRYRIY